MCRTRFLLCPPFLSPPPLRLDHFWKLARKSRRISRIGPAPARFRGLLTPRPRASANFSYFWVVMCLPTAMRAQLLAFRVALAMPPAPRVKVYGLFGIRSVHPRPCTHDPTPQPEQHLAQPGSAKSRSIDPPRSNESRVKVPSRAGL